MHGATVPEGPGTAQTFAAVMPRYLAGFLRFAGKGSFLLIGLANTSWLVFRDDCKKCVEKSDVDPRVAPEVSQRPQEWAERVCRARVGEFWPKDLGVDKLRVESRIRAPHDPALGSRPFVNGPEPLGACWRTPCWREPCLPAEAIGYQL